MDAIAEKIEQRDPAIEEIRQALDERVEAEDFELPRQPDAAARILTLAKTTDASMKDVIREVRTDAALANAAFSALLGTQLTLRPILSWTR